MIRWNVTLERELVEQRTLVNLPLAHHRPHSSSDAGSESMSRLRRNYRVFQRNRAESGPCSRSSPCRGSASCRPVTSNLTAIVGPVQQSFALTKAAHSV